jgi:hypothetical protein
VIAGLDEIKDKLGIKDWFDYQRDFYSEMLRRGNRVRECLYYRTGAGKSITALVGLLLVGHTKAVVVTPPSTYAQWEEVAAKLGMTVQCMSHAKFRMKGTKLDRNTAVIADEFHMFGGHGGMGWKKLDRLARGLQAPLILASATPNYNDAERVYCVKHILDPAGTKGGYLAFLYANCVTEQDPFSQTPKVLGFHQYTGAEEFLASLPGVHYLPDELVFSIQEHDVIINIPQEFYDYGYDRRNHRMVASAMERTHTEIALKAIDEYGFLDVQIHKTLDDLINSASGSVLVFANHATVATAVDRSRAAAGQCSELVHGGMSTKQKAAVLASFKRREFPVLVGTASLATGTDGLDKMCDTLIILDDTNDDALRRQLIGRIMPRGADADASKKTVHRINLL